MPLRYLLVVVGMSLTTPSLRCEELQTEIVISGLDGPFSVAIQPETGNVFVSESGAGQVIRVVDGQSRPVITGFATEEFGPEPKCRIGPLGLAFINKQTLVVGGGGNRDGQEVLYVFQLPLDVADPIAADTGTTIGPITSENNTPDVGNFFSVGFSRGTLFATATGNSPRGSLARAVKSPNAFESLGRFGEIKPTSVFRPIGMTLNARDDLVVSQAGEFSTDADSTLMFFAASDGRQLLNLKTGLHDIVALAYGPKKPNSTRVNLYALDIAWAAPNQGGLFRLDAKRLPDGTQEVEPTKLSALDRPTAMAFAEDGILFVSVLGTRTPGSDDKPGQLLRFAAGL